MSGVAKVSCILRHWGVQLILAYSWARPAIIVAGDVEGECFYFFCLFAFIPVPLSSLSLSFISLTISSISFLPFSGRRHKITHKGWRVVKPQNNQYLEFKSIKIALESRWNGYKCAFGVDRTMSMVARQENMRRGIRKCTLGHVRLAKILIRLRFRTVWSESSLGILWMCRLIWVFVGRTFPMVHFLTVRRISVWIWISDR